LGAKTVVEKIVFVFCGWRSKLEALRFYSKLEQIPVPHKTYEKYF
jgi:hypothetical protein